MIQNREQPGLPLAGIRILDIATLLAGPMIATVLADFGADVIKVEHPKGDPMRKWGWILHGSSLWWRLMARNKKGITLNLSHPKAQAIFKEMIPKFDVLVENFRPGTLERWGLGYEQLSKINPGLIMIRVTGYGQTGPYRNLPGFGTLAEGMSGFAHCNGFGDGPPTLPPTGLADSVTGLTGAIAVLIALRQRDAHSGWGQSIDLSIVESLLSLMGPQPAVYDEYGTVPGRIGNTLPFAAPRNIYRTMDDQWVALSASSQAIAERVFHAIGRPELIQDSKFKDNESRLVNNQELDEIIGHWISQHTRAEALKRFEEYEAALGPIYSIKDIMEDPHFMERQAIIEVPDPDLGKMKISNTPIRMSKTPGGFRHPAPALGADNSEFFSRALGFTEQELMDLKKQGII